MPFKGFSAFRLKEHFRKGWPLYLVGSIICVLLSNLLFTTTAPQIPDENQVLIYFVDVYPDAERLEIFADDLLAYGVENVDEGLREVEFQSISYNDPQQDMYSNMLLMARMSVGDGDVYITNNLAGQYLVNSEIGIPLDTYLEAGWMSEFGLTPITYESEETGEKYICALSLDGFDALADLGILRNPEGALLTIAANGHNIEQSMAIVEEMFRHIADGSYQAALAGTQGE